MKITEYPKLWGWMGGLVYVFGWVGWCVFVFANPGLRIASSMVKKNNTNLPQILTSTLAIYGKEVYNY